MDDPERPVTHETTVINTGERRGGAGTLIAIVLVLIVATLAFLYFGGYLQRAAKSTNINVNVDAPKIELPDVHIERPKSEPPAGNSAK
ncbi:MAG: hypothetical protein QOD42_2365 [Sphingomonadales bacterium]|jgi:archaellin|nr:hypothetical protein [Sphingomonadales bacterium]